MRHRYQPTYWGVWRDVESALDNYQRNLDGLAYCDVLTPPPEQRGIVSGFYTLSGGTLTLKKIEELLSSTMADPHGYGLLRPNPLPQFPQFPQLPPPELEHSYLYNLFFAPKPKPGEPTAATNSGYWNVPTIFRSGKRRYGRISRLSSGKMLSD